MCISRTVFPLRSPDPVMSRFDPYTPSRPYYECTQCGYRELTDALTECPDCGGRTHNIAVARE